MGRRTPGACLPLAMAVATVMGLRLSARSCRAPHERDHLAELLRRLEGDLGHVVALHPNRSAEDPGDRRSKALHDVLARTVCPYDLDREVVRRSLGHSVPAYRRRRHILAEQGDQ